MDLLATWLQVKTIDTPKVRLLPAVELKQREEALAAYSANLREGEWVFSFLPAVGEGGWVPVGTCRCA